MLLKPHEKKAPPESDGAFVGLIRRRLAERAAADS
jgi:hypothetical protein